MIFPLLFPLFPDSRLLPVLSIVSNLNSAFPIRLLLFAWGTDVTARQHSIQTSSLSSLLLVKPILPLVARNLGAEHSSSTFYFFWMTMIIGCLGILMSSFVQSHLMTSLVHLPLGRFLSGEVFPLLFYSSKGLVDFLLSISSCSFGEQILFLFAW